MRFIVKPRDTLTSIARRYSMQLDDLLAINAELSNPNILHKHQIIKFPDSAVFSHVVAPRDTLGRIAQRFGTTWEELLDYNPAIENPSAVEIDDVVTIPAFLIKGRLCDRRLFFNFYREAFEAKISQHQVDGIEYLLTNMARDVKITSLKEVAYMLATVKHETASQFQPIDEYGGLDWFDRYDPVLAPTRKWRERAVAMGNTQKGDGQKYHGRGYVQLTWKSNYQKMGEVLSLDLVDEPDLVKDPSIAYEILSYGMRHGSFTGKSLGDYINHHETDYLNARRVINGVDQHKKIAAIARKFEKVLVKSALN